MPQNSFTTTTTTGYGTRIGKSVGGAIAGVLMFLASFGVLYWNEGRTDLSVIAKTATDVSAAGAEASVAAGSLVSVTGTVATDETLGDGLYLKAGSYLAVDRTAEMYAWIEKKDEKSETNGGGSETTTTTYTYEMGWTDDPMETSAMQYPEGHTNPALTVSSDTFTVDALTVGNYTVAGDVAMPSRTELTLTKDSINVVNGTALSGNYVYKGTGTASAPQVGDVRVSYKVLKPGFSGTIFGAIDGSTIVQFTNDDGDSLYRLFTGTRTAAIATLHDEFVTMGWILRVVGFLMMWFGLMGVLGPISTLLDVLPFLGSTSRFAVSLITLPIALVLSIATILISMVLHSVVALVITLLVVIGVGIFVAKKWKKAPVAAV